MGELDLNGIFEALKNANVIDTYSGRNLNEVIDEIGKEYSKPGDTNKQAEEPNDVSLCVTAASETGFGVDSVVFDFAMEEGQHRLRINDGVDGDITKEEARTLWAILKKLGAKDAE